MRWTLPFLYQFLLQRSPRFTSWNIWKLDWGSQNSGFFFCPGRRPTWRPSRTRRADLGRPIATMRFVQRVCNERRKARWTCASKDSSPTCTCRAVASFVPCHLLLHFPTSTTWIYFECPFETPLDSRFVTVTRPRVVFASLLIWIYRSYLSSEKQATHLCFHVRVI